MPALGRGEQRKDDRKAEEKHCQLGQESHRGHQSENEPQAAHTTCGEIAGGAGAWGSSEAKHPRKQKTRERPPELIQHVHGEEGPRCHVVPAEKDGRSRYELRHPAAAHLAGHQAGNDNDRRASKGGDHVDGHEAVANAHAQERRKPTQQRRLIHVAGLEVPAVRQVVQLITKVAVVP